MISHKTVGLPLVLSVVVLSGCAGLGAPQLAQPAQLAAVAPQPIYGNSGEFMSPYTEDGVVAGWVDKAVNAKLGAAIGSQAGAYAGRKLMENVPFFGGMLGQRVGDAAGRKIAIEASGGWEYIKASSDLSFNTIEDLAVYIYAHHSSHPDYQQVLEATWEIYPELQTAYMPAIQNASRLVQ
jgi:hypothetical protein